MASASPAARSCTVPRSTPLVITALRWRLPWPGCGLRVRPRSKAPTRPPSLSPSSSPPWTACCSNKTGGQTCPPAAAPGEGLFELFGLSVVLHRPGLLVFLVDVRIGDGARRPLASFGFLRGFSRARSFLGRGEIGPDSRPGFASNRFFPLSHLARAEPPSAAHIAHGQRNFRRRHIGRPSARVPDRRGIGRTGV